MDKIFAICDYYIDGKTGRHSRHLYDIYKIYTNITLPDDFSHLVQSVRTVRSKLPICPSAQNGIDVNKLLSEIIEKEVYKKDYMEITTGLLFIPLSYDNAIKSLQEIIKSNAFS